MSNKQPLSKVEEENRQAIFNNLTKMKSLEQRIGKAGLTTIKPLAAELAKLSRQTFGRLAMGIYGNG